MQRTFLRIVVILFLFGMFTGTISAQNNIDSRLINHLFFITDDEHQFLIDTAGSTFIYSAYAEHHNLPIKPDQMSGNLVFTAQLPDDFPLPPPVLNEGNIVVREDHQIPPHQQLFDDFSGTLGQLWFGGRRILLDYKNSRIQTDVTLPAENRYPLKTLAQQGFNFPEISVDIAGNTYTMLLQTGGYVVLSDTFADQFPASFLATGFISESIYQKWKIDNPEWLILQDADKFYGSDIIRAENIRIGQTEVQFAWFAVRRDAVYQEYFSLWTPGSVVGSIGPDAFAGKKLWLDFNEGWFVVE